MLVDRKPDRLQRFDVHQQVVDHHARIAEPLDQRVGDHHSVQPAEGVVRHEKVALRGIEAFQPVDPVCDTHPFERHMDELLRRAVPSCGEDVVERLFVNGAPEPVPYETGDVFCESGRLFAQHFVDINSGHRNIRIVMQI